MATVRSQMKNLMGKTNTNRQSELIRLLSALPKTPPPGANSSQINAAYPV